MKINGSQHWLPGSLRRAGQLSQSTRSEITSSSFFSVISDLVLALLSHVPRLFLNGFSCLPVNVDV